MKSIKYSELKSHFQVLPTFHTINFLTNNSFSTLFYFYFISIDDVMMRYSCLECFLITLGRNFGELALHLGGPGLLYHQDSLVKFFIQHFPFDLTSKFCVNFNLEESLPPLEATYTHFTPEYRIRRKRMEGIVFLYRSMLNAVYNLLLTERGKISSILFLLILYTGVKWVLDKLKILFFSSSSSLPTYQYNFWGF